MKVKQFTKAAQVNIRMTASDRAKLEAAATAADRTLTDWGRRALLKAADIRKRRSA
jgi:uncharacterized protein (DUF1778 family)